MNFRLIFLFFILFISFLLLFYTKNYQNTKNKNLFLVEIKKENFINTWSNVLINTWSNVLINTWLILRSNVLINTWLILSWIQISNNFDYKSDNSITKYVSPNISYEKIDYIPLDLVFIKWNYIIDIKSNQTLRQEAKENLDKLAKEFYDTFNVKLKIISAYRSYNYQIWIKSRWCSDNFCAKAWFSEHQSWLAFDIFETTTKDIFLSNKNYTKYFQWMNKNAYKYGFHNTYAKWKEIDGYEIEPWHWRYVWVEFAKYLFENELTFGEFISNTY